MSTPTPVCVVELDTAGQAAWRGSAPPTALMASLGISPELCARGGSQHSGPRCCPVPLLRFRVAPSGRRCIQSG